VRAAHSSEQVAIAERAEPRWCAAVWGVFQTRAERYSVAVSAGSLLQLREFRFLSLASSLNSVGITGEQVVVGWLTLELTNSPFLVGVALSARMAPHVFVAIPAGVLADRVDRARLLVATSAAMAAVHLVLGMLVVLGTIQVWHLLVLTFAAGCLRAIHQTARQGYTHDLVGPGGLVQGLALLGLAMRLGGLVGSLVTGALIARFGSGIAYFAVAAGYLGSAITLGPVPARARPTGEPAGSVRDGLVGFLATLRADARFPALMGLTAAAEILGFSHQALLPSLARDVLGVGAEGLGAMTGARSVGGILGILAISGLGPVHGTGGLFLVTLVVFGASLVSLGLAGSFAWVLALLVLVNSVGALSDILSQSLIQLAAPGGQRGRAGGAWVLAIGLAPLGQLQIGALASLVGVTLALGASGVALMAVTALTAVLVPRLRHL
jgi:MFS family permease